MSLYGYKRRSKPALWLQLPGRRKSVRIARHSATELRLYRAEARAFVRAAIARGERCPVVAAVAEMRDGRRYGWPISDRLTEVHHKFGRLKKLLRWQRGWIAVSKQGHRWIHAHVAAARRLGFLAAAGEWNKKV